MSLGKCVDFVISKIRNILGPNWKFHNPVNLSSSFYEIKSIDNADVTFGEVVYYLNLASHIFTIFSSIMSAILVGTGLTIGTLCLNFIICSSWFYFTLIKMSRTGKMNDVLN